MTMLNKMNTDRAERGIHIPCQQTDGSWCCAGHDPNGKRRRVDVGELGTAIRFEIQTDAGWSIRYDGADAAEHVKALDAACALAGVHGMEFPGALPAVTPIPADLGAIVFFAFRYALGRMSVAPTVVQDYIRRNGNLLSVDDRAQMVKEISTAIKRRAAGMECDSDGWKEFAAWLEST